MHTSRILAVLFVLLTSTIWGQISVPARPFSLASSESIDPIVIPPPTIEFWADNQASINLPVNFNSENSGVWTKLPNGDRIWRLRVHVDSAAALSFYYDKFLLPSDGKFFVYNADQSNLRGAFTQNTLPGQQEFAHDYVQGEDIIIEYNGKSGSAQPIISINQLAYFPKKGLPLKSSQSCEVDVNCSEGDNWELQKKGVARLLFKIGGSTFWCSGSLINNTNQDCTPYLLSAEHCVSGASESDLNQTIAYFNYQNSSCDANDANTNSTILGCKLLASHELDNGTDFVLVLLNQSIPFDYDVYFNGWNIDNDAPNSGVGIHHPSGDVKKISTYTQSPSTNQITSGGNTGMNDGYWILTWSQTANGHGVTEGGSSGSPLFDQDGYIIGTLSGGTSSCNNKNGQDAYGRIEFHWDLNGLDSNTTLAYWLDPIGLNVQAISGSAQPCDNGLQFEIPEENSLELYPNPTFGLTTIRVETKDSVDIEIFVFNQLGQILDSKSVPAHYFHETSIDLSTYSAGTYLIAIRSKDYSTAQQLILAK